MKKFSVILVALFVALALGLAGCGVEHRGPGNQTGEPSGPGQEEKPPVVQPSDDEDAFTVKLVCGGVAFSPSAQIFAQWTEEDGYSIHRAPVDSKGVAKISGLDGDYKVTLSALPAGYTYDANVYSANNDERETVITLFRITPTTGSGNDLYDAIMLTDRGVYRATINYSGQTVYFRYKPTYTGEYSVSTLVDVTDNVINPLLDVHLGTGGYINPTPEAVVDTGGPENTYTKNLVWIKELGNTNYILTFGIRAVGMNNNPFPVNIDFILQWEGEFTGGEEIKKDVQVPKEEFVQQTVPEGKTFKYVAYLDSENRLLDTDMFKLWKKEDGGDGYYHFYDEITGYGELLYAKISKDNEVIITNSKSGFLDGFVRCEVGNKDYNDFIKNKYGSYCNADGVYPVTEELQIFLQEYATSQAIFDDGNGMAEKPGKNDDGTFFPGYNSGEHDMWLFACGYYS